MTATPPRMHAADRRAAIIDAAIPAFADGGYVGTSAEVIARRSGVTQPYVLRVFGGKKALFLAVVEAGFDSTRRLFEVEGARARTVDARPEAVLGALGEAYRRTLGNRDLLRLQLQAYAACHDPEIRAVVGDQMRRVYATVAQVSGASAPALDRFFAIGAMLNILAVIGPPDDSDSTVTWSVERFATYPPVRPDTEREGTPWDPRATPA